MTSPIVSTTTTNATITWATNEAARGTVYYSTLPLSLFEGVAGAAPVVGGQAVAESAFGFNHALNITSLQPGTWYYYAIGSADASGNLMLTWPSTFRTGL